MKPHRPRVSQAPHIQHRPRHVVAAAATPPPASSHQPHRKRRQHADLADEREQPAPPVAEPTPVLPPPPPWVTLDEVPRHWKCKLDLFERVVLTAFNTRNIPDGILITIEHLDDVPAVRALAVALAGDVCRVLDLKRPFDASLETKVVPETADFVFVFATSTTAIDARYKQPTLRVAVAEAAADAKLDGFDVVTPLDTGNAQELALYLHHQRLQSLLTRAKAVDNSNAPATWPRAFYGSDGISAVTVAARSVAERLAYLRSLAENPDLALQSARQAIGAVLIRLKIQDRWQLPATAIHKGGDTTVAICDGVALQWYRQDIVDVTQNLFSVVPNDKQQDNGFLLLSTTKKDVGTIYAITDTEEVITTTPMKLTLFTNVRAPPESLTLTSEYWSETALAERSVSALKTSAIYVPALSAHAVRSVRDARLQHIFNDAFGLSDTNKHVFWPTASARKPMPGIYTSTTRDSQYVACHYATLQDDGVGHAMPISQDLAKAAPWLRQMQTLHHTPPTLAFSVAEALSKSGGLRTMTEHAQQPVLAYRRLMNMSDRIRQLQPLTADDLAAHNNNGDDDDDDDDEQKGTVWTSLVAAMSPLSSETDVDSIVTACLGMTSARATSVDIPNWYLSGVPVLVVIPTKNNNDHEAIFRAQGDPEEARSAFENYYMSSREEVHFYAPAILKQNGVEAPYNRSIWCRIVPGRVDLSSGRLVLTFAPGQGLLDRLWVNGNSTASRDFLLSVQTDDLAVDLDAQSTTSPMTAQLAEFVAAVPAQTPEE